MIYFNRSLSFINATLDKASGKTCVTLQTIGAQLFQQLFDQYRVMAGTRKFVLQLLATVLSPGQKVAGTL